MGTILETRKGGNVQVSLLHTNHLTHGSLCLVCIVVHIVERLRPKGVQAPVRNWIYRDLFH